MKKKLFVSLLTALIMTSAVTVHAAGVRDLLEDSTVLFADESDVTESDLEMSAAEAAESDSESNAEIAESVLSDAEAVEEEGLPAGMCRSYLTGMIVPTEIGRARPMALMIENDLEAVKWQRGTSYADVMYEARVEGGITRIEAIFEDYKKPQMIMPIRSCRPQFLYYSREFKAFYGHYGQVIYAVPILQQSETYDVAGIPYGEDGQEYSLLDGSSAYKRDHAGVTGIFTTYEMLHGFFERCGWDTKYPEDYKGHYLFAEDNETVNLDDGQDALVVIPGFVSNHARFDYDETDGLYYRSEFGDPQVDHLNDQQLAFKNILIQIGPSYDFDGKYLFTDPVNQGQAGEGWYITNGKAERITWQKENWSADDPVVISVGSANYTFDVRDCDFNVTRYYDMDGNEIKLNQGKTFVEIVRDEDASKLVISDDPDIDTYVIDGM